MYKYLFKQEMYQKHYEIYNKNDCCYDYNKYKIRESQPTLIEENHICSCELDEPCLKIGDLFYIESMNEKINITNIIRNSNNEFICYIDPKYTENEQENMNLKEKCKILNEKRELENKISDLERDVNYLNRNIEVYASFQEKVKNNFWYRFMKKKVENKRFNKKVKTKI